MADERGFKGIWIPKEIWLDERLNALDKVILAEIDSLDNSDAGCYASNEHIAEFCQCTARKVSSAITKLKDLGYIYIKAFDGRKRVIKSNVNFNKAEWNIFQDSIENFSMQSRKKCKADKKKFLQSNIDSKIDSRIDENKENTKRKSFCSDVVEKFNSICISFPKVSKLTDSREKTIKARLKEYSMQDIIIVFEKAEKSDFLKGKSGKFKASFDWLMKPANFIKVLEGNYDNRSDGNEQYFTNLKPVDTYKSTVL